MSVERGQARSSVCTPCRGTGQLVSNLGGSAHRVVCPWCDGTGEFISGRDAQESPAEGRAESAGAGTQPPPAEGAQETPADSR